MRACASKIVSKIRWGKSYNCGIKGTTVLLKSAQSARDFITGSDMVREGALLAQQSTRCPWRTIISMYVRGTLQILYDR